MSRLFYVIGNPIEHSLSPVIHAAFAQKAGLDIHYEKLLFAVEDFAGQLRQLLAAEPVYGANVTVPFKREAYKACTTISERARLAGAVNTLSFQKGGVVFGDNTDGIGFVNDLKRLYGGNLSEARLLLLGAGGAARGLLAVLPTYVRAVTIANRTQAKAFDLAETFGVSASSLEATKNGTWEIVVNATSASLSDAVPAVAPGVFARAALCYDLMYARTATPFMQTARSVGCPNVHDGLGMLVAQAAESFQIWNGIRPPVESVLAALRAPH